MNIRITDPELDGQVAKVVIDDNDRLPHTWYIVGQRLLARLHHVLMAPWDDGLLAAFESKGLKVEVVAQRAQTGGDKVALFCKWYKHYKGINYRATPADGKRLKDFSADLSERLLKFYMDDEKMPDTPTTWLFRGKQSVNNLLRYWNEVNAAMLAPPPSRFPNTWDPKIAQRLTGPELSGYYAHLRGLGLKPIHWHDGTIRTWE